MIRILVTGASGFIGGNVVKYLASNRSYKVTATGRSATSNFINLGNVTYMQMDLCEKIPPLEYDICIHCAGLADDHSSYKELMKHNCFATTSLIESLNNCRLFIYISSASVYDFSDGLLKTENNTAIENCLSAYGKSKMLAEGIVAKSQIQSVYILRPRAVYGKGDRVLLPRILKLIKGKTMIVPGMLNSICSLTHIENLLEAVVKCTHYQKPGIHIFNIADRDTYNLKEVLGAILLKKTRKINFIYIPLFILKGIVRISALTRLRTTFNKQSLNYLIWDSCISIQKAVTEFDYNGKFSFFESLDQLEI